MLAEILIQWVCGRSQESGFDAGVVVAMQIGCQCKLVWFGAGGERGAVETSGHMSQCHHGCVLPDSWAVAKAKATLSALMN